MNFKIGDYIEVDKLRGTIHSVHPSEFCLLREDGISGGGCDGTCGVSEWQCPACAIRIGRWSGKRLTGNEQEPRYGKQ